MTETDPFPASPQGLRDDPAVPTIEHQPEAPTLSSPLPVKARRGGAGGTFFTLFLFLLLAGALYYVWANPRVPDQSDAAGALQRQVEAQAQTVAQQTGQLQALSQRMQTLTDRIDRLEKAASTPASAAPSAPTQASPADLGNLPQRVDELAAKVAALGGQTASTGAPDLGDLPQRVDALSAKVAALANQAAPTPAESGAEQQAVAALGQRLAQLGQVQAQQKDALDQTQSIVLAQQKTALSQIDGRLTKLELGAGKVEDAASRATRLERVQAAVVALQAGQKLGEIPGAPPELARFANQAPPTEAALRESFPALAEHARAVSQPDTAHRSFLQRTLSRLQQSVTVRQGNDVLIGDPAAGVLSDAAMRVQNGDLAGAVQLLRALHGPAAVAMAGWVDQARALVAARAALANLAARG